MARVYDEATILLLVFNHHKKHKTIFFFAEFAFRECLVRNTELNTFSLGHQHGEIVLPWLVGTKHVPESKTLPRIQNISSAGTCFWILGRVLDSGKCFGFREVFWNLGRVLDSGKCFGFWEVFWILVSVLSLQATD